MSTKTLQPLGHAPTQWLSRALVYGTLLVAGLFFLAPMYVMLSTSLKDAEQIRSGNLLSLPMSLHWDSWTLAWSGACTGTDCRGLQPYFINSVLMAVPAVLRAAVVMVAV